MNYKKYCKVFISRLTVALAFTVLTACSSGGGSNRVSLPAAGVSYVGFSDQATIDAASADVIAADIAADMAGAELENLSGNVTGVTTVGISDSDGKAMRYAALERLKQDAFHIIEDIQDDSVSGYGHVAIGNCFDFLGVGYSNGTASGAVLEQSSSRIVVKVSYNNLCYTDGPLATASFAVVLNGDMYMVISGSNLTNASFRIDSMRFYMPSFTIAFTDFTVSPAETIIATITEDWIVYFEYDADGFLIGTTISIAVNVSYNGDVYRFEFVDDNGIITERFYHPDYGYVEITVAGTFTYGGCPDPYDPDGGSVTITGDDGFGSTVTYRVTVTGCGTYLVELL